MAHIVAGIGSQSDFYVALGREPEIREKETTEKTGSITASRIHHTTALLLNSMKKMMK
jgi:hypothetical protein